MMGYCHPASVQFAGQWAFIPRFTLSPSQYRVLFRLAIAAIYLSYGILAWKLPQIGARWSASWVIAAAVPPVLLAVFFPPNLSSDAYSYLAYGRMMGGYHLNPYCHAPIDLCASGDPTCLYIWKNPNQYPCPYGPLWTLLTEWITALFPKLGAAVIAIKLTQATALVATALLGRSAAQRLRPESATVVFWLLALNPLLLVEGPGNGHCDLLLILFLIGAATFALDLNWRAASLTLGCAAGIKLIVVAAIPWLAIERIRSRGERPLLFDLVETIVLALAPIVLWFAPFWHGSATLEGLRRQGMAGAGGTALAQLAAWTGWLRAHHVPGAEGLAGAAWQWPLILCFALATGWVWTRRGQSPWLSAWILLIIGWSLVRRGLWLPWYFSWAWAPCLIRQERLYSILSVLVGGLAMGYTLAYSFP